MNPQYELSLTEITCSKCEKRITLRSLHEHSCEFEMQNTYESTVGRGGKKLNLNFGDDKHSEDLSTPPASVLKHVLDSIRSDRPNSIDSNVVNTNQELSLPRRRENEHNAERDERLTSFHSNRSPSERLSSKNNRQEKREKTNGEMLKNILTDVKKSMVADIPAANSFGPANRQQIRDMNSRPLNESSNSLFKDYFQCQRCEKDFHYGDPGIEYRFLCYYHRRCFKCDDCGVLLDMEMCSSKRKSRQSQEGIYCKQHDEKNKSIKSDVPVRKSSLSAASQASTINSQFCCHHCQKPLDEKTGYKRDDRGRAYCLDDYKELFMCRACGKEVKKAIKSESGKLTGRWHEECFTCSDCHQRFPDSTFYVFNNQQYCKKHFQKRTYCRGCSKAISGQYYKTAEDRRYHEGCFASYRKAERRRTKL